MSGVVNADESPRCTGLWSLVTVARYFGVHVDSSLIRGELGLTDDHCNNGDLVRGIGLLGLKSRLLAGQDAQRLKSIRQPAILRMGDGEYIILSEYQHGECALLRAGWPPHSRSLDMLMKNWTGELILVAPGDQAATGGDKAEEYGLQSYVSALWKYRKALAHVLTASLFLQVFALTTPILTQIVLDKVVVHQSTSTLMIVFVGLVLIAIFDATLQHLRTVALSHTASRLDVEFGQRIFRHLLRLPARYFDEIAVGQVAARVREIDVIRSFLTGQGMTALLDILFSLMFFIVMFAYSKTLSVIVLLSIPLYFLVVAIVRPIIMRRTNERFQANARLQQLLIESLVSAQLLKAMALEGLIGREWDEKRAQLAQRSFRASVTASLGLNIIQIVSRLVGAIVLYVGARLVMDGEMTVGQFIASTMIAGQVVAPILRMSQLWQELQQVQTSIARIGEIMRTPEESQTSVRANFQPINGDIKFEDVSFRYRNDGPDVLESINLQIPAGQVIGIVGESGSGKSTLTKLVQRLYVPTRGRVLIDGFDTHRIPPVWIRRQLGVVLQENVLLNRSIHQNIALGAPQMTRADVIAVAKMAGADDFVSNLPDGYDTVIEERGANLSGGQRQRLAIARALACNPRILVLDEATSAVDYESERLIQQNLTDIVRDRTVIIVAHRLASVRLCDRILALDRGQVVEDGAHEKLMTIENGIYRRLWTLQSELAAR